MEPLTKMICATGLAVMILGRLFFGFSIVLVGILVVLAGIGGEIIMKR